MPSTWLFQKEVHAVEINDGMTVVQRIHPQDPADSGTALQQREIRQCRNAKFRWRRFEAANLKVVDLSCTNFARRATSKMRRHSCCFHRNADRFKESLVENRNKCARMDEQTSGLPVNRTRHRQGAVRLSLQGALGEFLGRSNGTDMHSSCLIDFREHKF